MARAGQEGREVEQGRFGGGIAERVLEIQLTEFMVLSLWFWKYS